MVYSSKGRSFLPLSVLICLCNSLFSYFLQYGILVWGLTHDNDINAVFLLQKGVVKAISFEYFTSSLHLLFFNLKSLILYDLFKLKLLSFVYDCASKTSPSCFHSLLPLAGSVHQYGTRQDGKYDIYLSHKNTLQYGLRSVRFFGAKC